jgi:hypothetical protein
MRPTREIESTEVFALAATFVAVFVVLAIFVALLWGATAPPR